MEVENKELINIIRTNHIMNKIYKLAKSEGIDENRMLVKALICLLNLKDEAMQEKIDGMMRRPTDEIMEALNLTSKVGTS